MTNDTEVTVINEPATETPPRRPRTRKVLLICVTLVLIFAIGSGIMLMCALTPLSIEGGQRMPEAEDFFTLSFLPLSCTTDLSDSALNSVGTHNIQYTLFGIPLTTTLTVDDTQPPVFTMRDHAILLGSVVEAEDFFTDASDYSSFSTSLSLPENWMESGTHTVTVQFTDEHGNSSIGTSSLMVYDVENTITLEAGSGPALCLEALHAHVPEAELQDGFADILWDVPGEYPVSLWIQEKLFEIQIRIADTTPPEATLKRVYTILNRRVSADAFLVSTHDVTDVRASFETEPDTGTPGVQSVTILLSDTSGNTASFPATLYVYDIPSAVTAEAGSSSEALLSIILQERYGRSGYSFTESDLAAEELPVGVHTLSLHTPPGEFPVEVTLVDTTPPSAIGKRVTVYKNEHTPPTAEDFVTDVQDVSSVTVSFTEEPDFVTLGRRTVTIQLTDEAGNTASVTATLLVSAEAAPPQITGVKDITVFAGEYISYLSGVSATDTDGNRLTISVDTSQVQPGVPGSYRIVYRVVDQRGKTASAHATLTIRAITEDILQPYADKVLRGILTEDMTQREAARAIYDWMTTHVSYRVYADKSDWLRAAYSGFTTGYGDCFVYYAMSRFLLDSAGIENLEIQRNIPDKPHFWNLINCGDGWYHFDTCPHYKQFPLTSFMLTDEEVRNYSENCVKDYYSFDASLYPETP